MPNDDTIYRRPAELLQTLIGFDTTNPPGNEAACIRYIDSLLRDAGLQTTILAHDPARPNLLARLPGRGQAAPLLLQGHVDVVTTAGQDWQHPPFAAQLVDGYIWGRGALDMKSGIAMMLAAVLRARAEGFAPAGDILLLILSDEEAGGDMGAKFMVEEHPGLFDGVRYAIGEVGGTSTYIAGQRFYPIMVAEKQICWLRGRVCGRGGHASRPLRNGAMAKLGRILTDITATRLPVHVTPVVQEMLVKMKEALPDPTSELLTRLMQPETVDDALDLLDEATAGLLDPMLHNTVSPTIVHGGQKINVIPSEILLELDGRLLPEFSPEDMLAELQAVVGDELKLEVVRYDPGTGAPDMALFDMLSRILSEMDPEGVPVPFLLTGVTDARFFARLGIQTYGFLPLNLPPDFRASSTVHAADERVPAESVAFGTDAVYQVLKRYR